MTSIPILSQLWRSHSAKPARILNRIRASVAHPLYPRTQHPRQLPRFVREDPVATRYLQFLQPLDWQRFPERDLQQYRFCPPVPYAPFAVACLVKLQETLPYMSRLRTYLVEHPALTWLLGFPLVPSRRTPWGFDPDASLPTVRHFTRMLRTMPNACLQWLLDETVRLLQQEFASLTDTFGQTISLDTKLILAWVKENNPKAYVTERYDKQQRLTGDPDCRLGCKRKRNQRTAAEPQTASNEPPTPRSNPLAASGLKIGEYYWGYATGVVATKVPGWAEVVLAELTQPFDQPDVSYFFPLLEDTERRLGFRPRYGAFDAAFDA